MHARIDQLLSIRDGEPIEAVVTQHVSECPRCTAELQQLARQREALRQLPEYTAPDMRSRIEGPREARRLGQGWIAASAALVLGIVAAIGYREHTSEPAPREPVVARALSDEQINALLARSHQLERALQSLPQRPALERAGTAATIDGLEQRIQWLDHHLSYAHDAGLDHDQTAQLWQERVALLDTLVKVRYAESGTYVF